MTTSYDLIVIGGGPGGYAGAIRAAQLGFKTACIEKEEILGGTCLRVGCIPSKALLQSSELFHEAQHSFADHGIESDNLRFDLDKMLKRKERVVTTLGRGINALMKKNKITRYSGLGSILGDEEGGLVRVAVTKSEGVEEISAKHVIIATGSKVAQLRGIQIDGDRIGTSAEALSYPEVPKHLVVIGAGAIGLELGSVWSRLGAEVTVLEYLDRIIPGMDTELAGSFQKILTKQGLKFRLGTRVTGAEVKEEGCLVHIDGSEPIECDRVLMAVGRVPNTEGLGLENTGITTDTRGRIPVNGHFQTSSSGIYAIGDVIAGPMLAHKAEEEAIACVERIITGYGHVDYSTIPYIVYTSPEFAGVGSTEALLKEQGIPYKKGSFPFMANGRAKAMAINEGMVKVLAHAETDRVLGVHILGVQAGELIAEAAAAMSYGASSEDLARTCHAHPTLAETIKEAAMAVDGRAIHM